MVGGEERPPTGGAPEHGPSPAVEAQTNTGTPQTIREEVQNLLSNEENKQAVQETVRELVQENTDGSKTTLQDEETKKKARALQIRLRNLIKKIQDPVILAQVDFLPDQVKAVLQSLDANKLTEKSNPIVFKLLEETVDQNFDNIDLINKLADELSPVKLLDPVTSASVLKAVNEKAVDLGIDNDVQNEIHDFVEVVSYHNQPTGQSHIDALNVVAKKNDRLVSDISLIPIPDEFILRKLQGSAELSELESAKVSGDLPEEDYRVRKRELIKMERDRILYDLRLSYEDIFSSLPKPSDPDGLSSEQLSELRRKQFLGKMTDLVNEGCFEQDKLLEVRRNMEEVLTLYEEYEVKREEMRQASLLHEGRPGVLRQEALRAGINEFSSSELDNLFNAMETNEGFLEYFKTVYVNSGEAPKDWWARFVRDTKGIFEDVLSIAEQNPLAFFQEAFVDFYQGQFYRSLIYRLTELGNVISTDADLKDLKVEIKGVTSMEDRSQEGRGLHGKQHMLHRGTIERSLSEAVGVSLGLKMTTLKNLTEFLHNTGAIVELGLKWETLHEQAERISLADIDALFLDEPDLRDSYNLYTSALKAELGLNRHIAPSSFGAKDDYQFDFAEATVYKQLLAREEQRQGTLNDAAKKRLRRMARMASALSKGVTGEYWGILLTARMPLTFEFVKEDVLDKHGRTIYEKDANGKKVKKTRYVTKRKTLYTSMQAAGFERMLGQLDQDLVFDRFGVPDHYQVARFVYAPRDLAHFKGAYTRDKFNGWYEHGMPYRIQREIESAFFSGRSEFLEEFDEDNVTMSENLKANSVDMIFRAGWRFNQYREYVIYTGDPETSEIDFKKTMHNLKQKGFRAIMAFIENVDFDKLPQTERDKYKAAYKALPSARKEKFKDAKEFFKEDAYREFIFERMSKISPSQWIGIEMPRYTPFGEEFIDDRMTAFLKQSGHFGNLPTEFVHDHIMKLFTTSLELAEKQTWQRKNRDLDIKDEEFSSADIDAGREELLGYFKLYRDSLLDFQDSQGLITYGLGTLTEENFIEELKKFTDHLTDTLGPTHVRTRQKDNGSWENVRETYGERYAHLLHKKIGTLPYLIGGSDFDFSDFLLSQAGRRVPARAMSEANVVATKMNPEFGKLISEVIPHFVTSGVKSGPEMERALVELLKPVQAFSLAYGMAVDPEEGRRIALRFGIFLERMLAKDRVYRTKGLGDLAEFLLRTRRGAQSSLMNDVFQQHIGRHVSALETEDLVTMGRILANTCDIPWTSRKIIGSQEVQSITAKILRKISGGAINFKRPLYSEKGYEVHMGQFRKAVGTTGLARTVETHIPIGTLIGLLLILSQLRAAYKANEKG